MKSDLEAFASLNKFSGKGPLSVALVITEQAKAESFPLRPNDFLAVSGTQVSGLGFASVQAILIRNGINRVLAKEGGRTSRGSVSNMMCYVDFLNKAHAAGRLNLKVAEDFWISRVQAFFAGKPFSLRLDPNTGIKSVIRNLMRQAAERQKNDNGTMYLGTMMQHLVGAKLDVVMGPDSGLAHYNANQNDHDEARTGDFDIGDVSIHVSTAPSEALIQRCVENLSIGKRPIILTGRKGLSVAEGLAENSDLLDRIDIIEFEQFFATTIYEAGKFTFKNRKSKFKELIDRYNEIIEEVETDPSLKIEFAKGK